MGVSHTASLLLKRKGAGEGPGNPALRLASGQNYWTNTDMSGSKWEAPPFPTLGRGSCPRAGSAPGLWIMARGGKGSSELLPRAFETSQWRAPL